MKWILGDNVNINDIIATAVGLSIEEVEKLK